MFFLLKTNVFVFELVLMIDSAPTLDVLVKVFQFGIFCYNNKRVSAPYGLKPGCCNYILLLA